MFQEDIKTYSEIGRALWVDPDRSMSRTLETLEIASLLESTSEGLLEKASQALLQRALSEGTAANTNGNFVSIHNPFYRLAALDRFVLVALHRGHWTYARVARMIAGTVEQVQEVAWRARLQLATRLYPVGAAAQGVSCPQYLPLSPWTQRFLDDEVHSGQERLFLQNHLMACDDCRNAFLRCKDVYYDVDAVVSSVGLTSEADAAGFKTIEKRLQKNARMRVPMERTFLDTIAIFIRRRDVQVVLLGLGILFVVKVVSLLSQFLLQH